jgi:outer membrane immunogenic protein
LRSDILVEFYSRAGSISSGGYSLTLSTFTVDARYFPRTGHSHVQAFGQVLVGLVHSSGTLVGGSNPGAANAGAAFAANICGGLDLKANRSFAIRLIEADYLVTTVDNSSNNHQNNLRISAGVVVRFEAYDRAV